ncbi:hypothetical protein [Halosimplex pelagicum]|uniref:Uncharacterized protein n=1 Tax=Halosimplex pelagicum TaxID=869886 RepID=A0A7D5PD26_9EURY|nr:hypothetical protein [Halosimplex pelagicum]QLH83742.1 hypothetical protein HZS54_19825 [Halosimplex pelagicum]
MDFEHGVGGIGRDAAAELERAARDVDAVEVVESPDGSVALRGDSDAVQSVRRALWARQLSAEQFGQDGLAAADATARGRLAGSP